MKTIFNRSLLFAALLMIGAGVSLTYAAKNFWKSGRVIASSLNGHGRTGNPKTMGTRYKDIWWNYCISSGDQAYSVVSREDPVSAGLKENNAVRFLEKRNQIFVINPAGKRIELKILRKDLAPKCP